MSMPGGFTSACTLIWYDLRDLYMFPLAYLQDMSYPLIYAS